MPNAVDHAEAALERLTLADLDRMSPARLRRFEATLYHWQQLAHAKMRKPQEPKSGVLAALKDGERQP